jgi:hypothetical protein
MRISQSCQSCQSGESPEGLTRLEPAPVEPEKHVHRWHVVSFEATSQVVGYRCRDCGLERFERPETREARRP